MQELIFRKKRIALVMVFMLVLLSMPSISYAADSADDIKYDVDAGDELDFDEDDFYDACEDFIDDYRLNYVQFDLPSSSRGILYYDYDGDDEEKVKSSYTYGDDGDDGSIDDVSFVANEDYSGTFTLSYEGVYDDNEEFTGKIRITVNGNDEAEKITYSIDSDETAEFDEDDFNEACQDLYDEDLVYINFTLPSSSKGILYYDYDDDDEEKVSKSTDYYYDDDPSIDDITFVPNEDYSGTVVIGYNGYDEDDNSFAGTVEIRVEESSRESGDINYSVDADDEIEFDEDDFNDYSEDENDETLDYIRFTIPASSKGVLYYDYDGDDEEKVKSSDKYYYDDDPSIDDITFVPNKSFSGVCNIEFNGYDTEGNSIDGIVEITVSGGNLRSASVISYTAQTGSIVYFKDEDFNKVCKELMDEPLAYVKFNLPSAASGKLYYGYTSSKDYTSAVSSSAKYYYTTTPFLLNVVFVPAGNAVGTTTIGYTGFDSEGSAYNGTVQITYSASGTAALKKSRYFKDVDEAYSWAVDYIDNLYTSGVIAGTTSDSSTKYFSPASKITRGEFILMLYRALGLQASSSSDNFSDVAKGSYYYDAVASAKALGIAQGSENKFYPNSSITRGDTMVLALRAMNKSGRTVAAGDTSILSAYSDSYVIDSYAKEPVAALIKAGIITGSDDNKLHPMESITRAEAAAIIYRIKNK